MPQDPIKVWKIRDNLYAPDTPEMRRNHPDGEVMLVQKPTYSEIQEGKTEVIEIPCDDEGNRVIEGEAVEVPKPEPDEEQPDEDFFESDAESEQMYSESALPLFEDNP